MVINVYVNIDILTVQDAVSSIDTIYQQGYYLNKKPILNVLDALKKFKRKDEIKIHIISLYPDASKFALFERNKWIDKYLPEVTPDNRIFISYGKKNLFEQYNDDSILIDNFLQNLQLWKGIGIMASRNSENMEWCGVSVDTSLNSSILFYTLKRLIIEQYVIKAAQKKYIGILEYEKT